MKRILLVLGTLTVGILAYILYQRDAETKIWKSLAEQVPAKALEPQDAILTIGAITTYRVTAEQDTTGHVRVANGDIWRFAFRSHHLLDGDDSYSVFAGPSGTFRMRGNRFCCEVEVPSNPPPRDSAEFLAYLRGAHDFFEPLPSASMPARLTRGY
jgi:hypothetical protein